MQGSASLLSEESQQQRALQRPGALAPGGAHSAAWKAVGNWWCGCRALDVAVTPAQRSVSAGHGHGAPRKPARARSRWHGSGLPAIQLLNPCVLQHTALGPPVAPTQRHHRMHHTALGAPRQVSSHPKSLALAGGHPLYIAFGPGERWRGK